MFKKNGISKISAEVQTSPRRDRSHIKHATPTQVKIAENESHDMEDSFMAKKTIYD
jgi:hypothetical protein